MSFYREQLEGYLSLLDVNASTVLDVGGGQNPIKGRTKSWTVKDYHILDLPDYDLNNPKGKLIGWKGMADIVFCLEVFEYLINPLVAIKNIANLLKPTGRAYVTFCFSYPHHNELEFDSLRYTEPGIYRLTTEAGLNVDKITYRIDKSGLLESFYAADGMRAAKQYPRHNVTGFIVEMTR